MPRVVVEHDDHHVHLKIAAPRNSHTRQIPSIASARIRTGLLGFQGYALNRLPSVQKLRKIPPRMKNSIANLKTITAQSSDGPVPIILMGLNIEDHDSAEQFIAEVAEKFKAQRMCSPPTTSRMLITILSAMPLERFVSKWKALAAEDQILGFFMSLMEEADVLRGTTAGVTLESASLVAPQ